MLFYNFFEVIETIGDVFMGWRKRIQEDTYSDDEVEQRIKEELPHWYLDKGWIKRKYKTSGWKATLMVVNTIGHLSEAAFHHPDLNVSYAFVIVKLMNHAAKGITNKDFELALKIEEMIMWQPGKENGCLEGTPNDPRFKYIKYDV
jgi:4a-hydroxytetrahydrobiopterin dehydratase